MTRDDIIRMAWESDLLTITEPNKYQVWIPENLERFATIVAAAEREECAKICEMPWQGHPYDIAKQIRARGQG